MKVYSVVTITNHHTSAIEFETRSEAEAIKMKIEKEWKECEVPYPIAVFVREMDKIVPKFMGVPQIGG